MKRRVVKKKLPDAERQAEIIKDLRSDVVTRQQGYRERALKLFPHICAGCGREFSGRNLQQLTVHHKDGNWKNNPTDGSNWELLCLYCHDYEHEKTLPKNRSDGSGTSDPAPSIFNPFEDLDDLLEAAADDDKDDA